MEKKEMLQILETDDFGFIDSIFQSAYETKLEYTGNKVYFRGIIEFSNLCTKDCFYCGIRKSNVSLKRFSMTQDEIIEAALFADKSGYGSIVLQSGERTDEEFVSFIEQLIETIKQRTNNRLGITLSLGEQAADIFKRWHSAGAHRYLLRIETSNKKLYEHLHPDDHSYDKRLNCLDVLRDIGYQVGTGVMIGLPYQTNDDLANDILFFEKHDIDMIGMGPYIVHNDTPLAKSVTFDPQKNFLLGLKMIALARLHLKDINIASTTALQALDARGREEGLKAGANIIMPNITPVKYRNFYRLYEGKPCLDENASLCQSCLDERIQSIGEKIGYSQWGDSPHFFKRTGKMPKTD
ncbi:MAG: [FeFe] hydrogenase H-cluster radical SAM maturase HydE [Candidatus Omnitrophica bacterium]|jgi:biotin synthase|nr:[FeFe] hydrogenase H-cluster radical SAM maturase HydE [Candidatus Omnitrophota bacterium]